MSANPDTIRRVYEAFGRGDVPSILAVLAEDVRWESWADHSGQRAGHPLLVPRHGREAAGGFFSLLAAQTTVHDLKVLDVIGTGRQVAVEVAIDYTWNPTGQRVQDEELHLWTFDERGQVIRFRHYIDTAKHLKAAGLLAA